MSIKEDFGLTSLMQLSDNQLIDAYNKANESSLEEEFIQLLREELDRRGIEGQRTFQN